MLKRNIELSPDFTINASWRTVDKYDEGAITTFVLDEFFVRNNRRLTEDELMGIIRRIDFEGDAQISFQEWVEFFRSCSNEEFK